MHSLLLIIRTTGTDFLYFRVIFLCFLDVNQWLMHPLHTSPIFQLQKCLTYFGVILFFSPIPNYTPFTPLFFFYLGFPILFFIAPLSHQDEKSILLLSEFRVCVGTYDDLIQHAI